jgi:hypothetical protein
MADTYTLRESDPPGRVLLQRNGKTIHSDSEYRGTAQYALRVVGLTEAQVGDMYADYRTDAEERGVL